MSAHRQQSKDLRDMIQSDRIKFAINQFEKRGVKLEY
jgi:hypothetical protein